MFDSFNMILNLCGVKRGCEYQKKIVLGLCGEGGIRGSTRRAVALNLKRIQGCAASGFG
jgi:hypothetical protein